MVAKNAAKDFKTDFSIEQLDEFIGPSPKSALSGKSLTTDTASAWRVAVCSKQPGNGLAPYKWGQLELRAAGEMMPEASFQSGHGAPAGGPRGGWPR